MSLMRAWIALASSMARSFESNDWFVRGVSASSRGGGWYYSAGDQAYRSVGPLDRLQPGAALIRGQCRKFVARAIERLEVTAGPCEQRFERGNPPVVGGQKRDCRVVHPTLEPEVVGRAACPHRPERRIARSQSLEQACLRFALLGIGAGGRICDLEIAARVPRHIEKRGAAIGRDTVVLAELGPFCRLDPSAHAGTLHDDRKRLVELGVAGHVKPLVREFVEHDPGQEVLGQLDHGAQEGIVEPAQGRVRTHAGHRHVPTLGIERSGMLRGGGLGEVAPIAQASRHREAPAPGFERQLRCRHHVPDHVAAVEIDVVAVAGIRGQAQGAGREVPDVEGGAEPCGKARLGIGVRDDRLDGTRPGHQPQVAGHRLRVVPDARAPGEREDGERHEEASGSRHATALNDRAFHPDRYRGRVPRAGRQRPSPTRTTSSSRCVRGRR